MAQDQRLQHCCPELCSDFAFAFDYPPFSDRILKLLVYDDLPEEKSDNGRAEHCKLNDLLSSLRQRKELMFEKQKESRVRSLHINSLVLAARSSFFHKLFTNGMKACNQHEVTMCIHSSEEEATMNVLKFMYNKNLISANAPNALVEVLVAADKYDVPSCASYCCRLLLSFPMTDELALLYIDLPSIISMVTIQPLLTAAKAFLPNILKDIAKYRNDIMNLSINGIKDILLSDDLKVQSEDEVYDLLVEWSKEHFPNSEERCKYFKTEVFNLLRLRHMTSGKLKEMLGELSSNNSLDLGTVTSIMEAVFNGNVSSLLRHRRAYKMLPVAVTTFEFPVKQCVVYLDVKNEEFEDASFLSSRNFIFEENSFYLTIHLTDDPGYRICKLNLHLVAKEKQAPLNVELCASVRRSSSPNVFERNGSSITHHTFSIAEDVASIRNIFSNHNYYYYSSHTEVNSHIKLDITLTP